MLRVYLKEVNFVNAYEASFNYYIYIFMSDTGGHNLFYLGKTTTITTYKTKPNLQVTAPLSINH